MVQRIYLPKSGSYGVFKVKEEALPGLGSEDVLIDIHYSGVNFADLLMRQGLYPDAPSFPFVPGYELSGLVTAVGIGVTHIKPGDRVLAGCYFGGYSSQVVLPAWQVTKLPDEISLAQGAAIPVSFLTAYFCLFDEGRVRNGDRILIDCATGSLGSICFQLLKEMDVEIVGLTSSPEKKSLIESFGAQAYTHEEFYQNEQIKNFDFILNSLGGDSMRKHYNRLGPTGRMVCIGASNAVGKGKRSWLKAISTFIRMPRFNSVELMNDNRGVFGLNVLRLFEHQDFIKDRLSKFKDFSLSPVVDKVFPYQQAGDAHAYIEDRKARGKVLLEWQGNA